MATEVLSRNRVLPAQPVPVRKWLAHGIVVLLGLTAIFFIHEMNHAALAILLGGRVLSFNVLGAQWFPRFIWMPQFGFGGFVFWSTPFSLTAPNMILAAGSTGTLMISVCASLLLSALPWRGIARTLLIVLSLYFLDSVIHLIPVIGVSYYWAPMNVRSFSEAFFAFADLGVPGPVYKGGVVLISLLDIGLVVRALRRDYRLS
jgi:hypothetical protein